MTHLVLVRHGETDWNLAGRIQGSTDVPLNATGREQAREAGRRLAGEHWDAVAASPLSRAAETARIVAEAVGVDDVELIAELAERNYGPVEGMTGAEIDARYGTHRLDEVPIDGRETRQDVLARVRPALLELAERHPGRSVLVVTHGGVIGTLVRDATRHTWPEPGQAITNGSHHRFAVRDGVLGLVEFNGTPWSQDLLGALD